MVFCNITDEEYGIYEPLGHNPYFNRWFSAITFSVIDSLLSDSVTILILIDGFLQFKLNDIILECSTSHNPYFNRWFSAICNNRR